MALLCILGLGDSRKILIYTARFWVLITVTKLPILVLCSVVFVRGRGVYLAGWAVEQHWFKVSHAHCRLFVVVVKSAASNCLTVLMGVLLSGNSAPHGPKIARCLSGYSSEGDILLWRTARAGGCSTGMVVSALNLMTTLVVSFATYIRGRQLSMHSETLQC